MKMKVRYTFISQDGCLPSSGKCFSGDKRWRQINQVAHASVWEVREPLCAHFKTITKLFFNSVKYTYWCKSFGYRSARPVANGSQVLEVFQGFTLQQIDNVDIHGNGITVIGWENMARHSFFDTSLLAMITHSPCQSSTLTLKCLFKKPQ